MTIQPCFEKPNAALWEKLNWYPTARQLEQFSTVQKLLSYYNTQVNLTRLIHGEDYWIGQIFDSLWPFQAELNHQPEKLTCIDVGTGCGFPGFAIAIGLTKATITLVDSTKKKTKILKEISRELGLNSRINVLTERIESTGQNRHYRSRYDLAIARAVADAPVVAEYLIPLIKQTGEALLFKGNWCQIESQNLTKALTILNASIEKIESIELPSNRGKRHLIRLKSLATCPSVYPRSIGVPAKKPLGL